MKLNAIILAAGKGTRMKSEMPKCAYPFCGKPMISYLLESCKKAGIENVVCVLGYKIDEMLKILPKDVKYAYQSEQLGTGHAAKCAYDVLNDEEGLTLVFPGDMPLIDSQTIKDLVTCHIESQNALTVVTTILDDPKAYGRIYRENGNVKKIVEFKDCTEEQKLIKEINVALYCLDNKLLFEALNGISNNNKANEYYFTDIIEIIGKDKKVDSFVVENDYRLTGINDLETLVEMERLYLEDQKK